MLGRSPQLRGAAEHLIDGSEIQSSHVIERRNKFHDLAKFFISNNFDFPFSGNTQFSSLAMLPRNVLEFANPTE